MTISSWNRDRLREVGAEASLIPPGIDLDTFHMRDIPRRDDMLLAIGRSNPLKNFPLTLDAWRALPEPRPELCLFGIEPELTPPEDGVRYLTRPTDEEVARLFNEATAFVQTSTHEGFCLPALEAMASGCAVVCTDAHGNRDFCDDGRNCLIAEQDIESVSGALSRILRDRAVRERVRSAGIETAAEYAWPRRIEALAEFLTEVARPRRIEPSTDTVPALRRAPVR